MPFILCFIAFDILDLDRSDLIALSKNFEISSFVGDIDPTPRIDPFPEPLELPNTAEILAPDLSGKHALLQFAEILKFANRYSAGSWLSNRSRATFSFKRLA